MIQTSRLLLRRWKPEDREPFAAMCADPVVMEYFSRPLTRELSDAFVDRIEAFFDSDGFGLWAVEVPGETAFAGFVGLNAPAFEASFTPCIEVGWRLARGFWGRGYATEAASAALEFGFSRLGLQEIVSFTVPANVRSVAVMKRIGMTFAGEFDHPGLPAGHPLQRHVLYRLKADDRNRSAPPYR